MTGPELKALRLSLGLSVPQMGRALGYQGSNLVQGIAVRRYESGNRVIPTWIGRLATMFAKHGVPQGWL